MSENNRNGARRIADILPNSKHINSLEKQTVNTISGAAGIGLFEQIMIHEGSDFSRMISIYG